MAEVSLLGARAALELVYAVTGMDAGRILNFQNRNGLDPQQILQQAYGAVGGANDFVVNRYQGMTYFTTDDHARYRQGEGGRRRTPKAAEFGKNDPVRSSEVGHMLPLSDYEDGLAWSWQYLRDAYQAQIDADLQLITESWLNEAEYSILNRMFSPTENAIGSGYDVPWAIGSGVSVPYIPPQGVNSTSFTSAHTHFQWAAGNDSAAAKTLIDKMIKELRHHGFDGRLVALVSEADVDTWAGVSGFVRLQPQGMTVVTTTSGSNVQVFTGEVSGMPGELFGFYNSSRGVVELRYLERIPTGYAFMTKSFGANNPANGLAIRLHPTTPFGLMPNPEITSTMQPQLKGIQLKATHGVGINRRLNGVAGYFATAISAYAAPTIS